MNKQDALIIFAYTAACLMYVYFLLRIKPQDTPLPIAPKQLSWRVITEHRLFRKTIS
jgi:hypothetical protein